MPNDLNFSVDVGTAIPYVLDRFLALFGKDQASTAATRALSRQLRIAAQHASHVQIIGMDQPVPISRIYQPTRLSFRQHEASFDFMELLRRERDAVILGGPGRGKTILTTYLFSRLLTDERYLPLLVTLRWPNAVPDLQNFVEGLAERRLKIKSEQRIVLLVDGYDEVWPRDRQLVDKALREFAALDIGNFYLTCRLHYDVSEVHGMHVEIAPFTRDDSMRYIRAFGRAYDVDLEPRVLLKELEDHGFADFAAHPLMLAMVCILKSGPVPRLPRNAIGLIRRALDTLTLRWDESKKIQRSTLLPLDGEDRIRCMMRIAFSMKELLAEETIVDRACREYLRLAQWTNVDASVLLQEIAGWYGILVPASASQWTFVHRTIHDFLAARFWVESGGFRPDTVTEWDARAAYAACLSPDATESLVRALEASHEIHGFVECLYNNAAFDAAAVANAVVRHFTSFPDTIKHSRRGKTIAVSTTQDFFAAASEEFLHALAIAGGAARSPAHDVVLAFAVSELDRRNREVAASIARAWVGRGNDRQLHFEVLREGVARHVVMR